MKSPNDDEGAGIMLLLLLLALGALILIGTLAPGCALADDGTSGTAGRREVRKIDARVAICMLAIGCGASGPGTGLTPGRRPVPVGDAAALDDVALPARDALQPLEVPREVAAPPPDTLGAPASWRTCAESEYHLVLADGGPLSSCRGYSWDGYPCILCEAPGGGPVVGCKTVGNRCGAFPLICVRACEECTRHGAETCPTDGGGQ